MGFIIGLIIGANAGFIILGLMTAASEGGKNEKGSL